jgi:hypothetical protein
VKFFFVYFPAGRLVLILVSGRKGGVARFGRRGADVMVGAVRWEVRGLENWNWTWG